MSPIGFFDVVEAPDGLAAVWTDGDGLWFRRFDRTGAPRTDAALVAAQPTERFACAGEAAIYPSFQLVAADDGFGLAWWEGCEDSLSQVRFARLDASGAVVRRVALTDGAGEAQDAGLAWDGARFAATYWTGEGFTYRHRLQFLAPDGEPDGPPIEIAGDTRTLRPVATSAGVLFGRWVDERLRLARLAAGDDAPIDLAELALPAGRVPQNVRVAATGDTLAVAYAAVDGATLAADAYLARFDGDGAPRGEPLRLTTTDDVIAAWSYASYLHPLGDRLHLFLNRPAELDGFPAQALEHASVPSAGDGAPSPWRAVATTAFVHGAFPVGDGFLLVDIVRLRARYLCPER